LEGSFYEEEEEEEEDNEALELLQRSRQQKRHRSRGAYGDRYVPPYMHHPFQNPYYEGGFYYPPMMYPDYSRQNPYIMSGAVPRRNKGRANSTNPSNGSQRLARSTGRMN
jgi:hypothetical protein